MKKIGVIGLGYVGFPMLVALASLTKKNSNIFDVTGFENKDKEGIKKKNLILNNKMPISSNDLNLKKKFKKICNKNLIKINNDFKEIKNMDVIIVSINFDYKKKKIFKNLESLIKNIFSRVKKDSLIIIESTLIPGTCDKICLPIIKKILSKRKMSLNNVFFGYSYERVTPGENYLKSLMNTGRNYAGYNQAACKKIEFFFKKFFQKRNVRNFKFEKLIECETAKIIENSYRSLNIAFIHEWMEFSNSQKLNLNKILSSIRVRKTHSNIMRPGLGVVGYCLTKDPKFSIESSNKFFKGKFKFPLTKNSVVINKKLIEFSSNFIKSKVKELSKKKILFCGFSYKENVGDFRNSPTKALIKSLKIRKFSVYDPYLKNNNTLSELKIEKYDAIIFTVNHKEFRNFPFKKLKKKNMIFDLNNVINSKDIIKRDNFYSISNFNR